MYQNGRGVERNAANAFNWYKKSAEQGNYDALYELGNLYKNGEGTEKNTEEAIKCYLKAVENGKTSDSVFVNLGDLYIEQGKISEAIEYYTKSADSGGKGIKKLIKIYFEGTGIEKDYAKVLELSGKYNDPSYLKDKSKEGDDTAQKILGDFFFGRNEFKGALNWYRKSAEHGNPEAQTKLGTMYGEGLRTGG